MGVLTGGKNEGGNADSAKSGADGLAIDVHKTFQMTCRYAQLAPEQQLAARERLCETDSVVEKVAGAGHTTEPPMLVDARVEPTQELL
jgi:hypothetical protein